MEPTFTAEEICDELRFYGHRTPPGKAWPRKFTVELGDGETAWNPASTKELIHGPASVEYREYEDGGYQATVS